MKTTSDLCILLPISFTDSIVRRGCLSDSKLIEEECFENSYRNCLTCSESGCNFQDRSSPPKLECFTCNGTTECLWGQNDESLSISCSNEVLLGQEESCFVFVSDKQMVMRGCTLDNKSNDNWCRNDSRCSMCNQDNCNQQNVQLQSCFQCNGNTCSTVSGSGQACEGTYSFKQRGCFTLVQGE